MAFRYFLRDLIYESALNITRQQGDVNNYTKLVSACRQWSLENNAPVCFVSFNYDPLLEWACINEYNFDPSKFSDYVDNAPIYILKPHGSVLWSFDNEDIPSTPQVVTSPQMIEAGEPATNGNWKLYANSAPVEVFPISPGNNRSLFPALALPMDGGKELFGLLIRKNYSPLVSAMVLLGRY
jgi:hypothetical protein